MNNVVEIDTARAGRNFASQIRAAWQKSVESILETGRLLIEAKNQLEPGTFEAMIERDLPFTSSTADRLMAIARHTLLSDPAHGQALPPSWRTLYELTKLPDETLATKLADGTINCEIERKTVAAMIADSDPKSKSAASTVTDNGPRIVVPPGKTLADICRDGARLEANGGITTKEVAKQAGIGLKSYRQGRTVVLLAERNDLAERDAATVREALAEMNETRRTAHPYEMVTELADRVWGKSSIHNERARKLRIEQFDHAIILLVDTCMHGSEINIPHLADKEVSEAIAQIEEAFASLRKLVSRIKESRRK